MSMIIRMARQGDEDGLLRLAREAGTGMTTMPQTREGFAERIAASEAVCQSQGRAGPKDIFFFVLEIDGAIEGMASIFPALGEDRPFYSYRISKVAAAAPELGLQASSDLLYLCNDFHGYTEIGTLLVSDRARGTGAGRLLSLSRFLFMRTVADRISHNIMAEIRGNFRDDGSSPFWDAVASKFFAMNFDEADRRSAHDFRFIADLMPKFPIYTVLLPEDARATIGKPFALSQFAMNMLMSEGFRYTDCIDIFDGGPSLEADLNSIRTVRDAESTVVRIQAEKPAEEKARTMVAVPDAATFRVKLIHRQPRDKSLFLTPEEAAALGVGSGDHVLSVPFKAARRI